MDYMGLAVHFPERLLNLITHLLKDKVLGFKINIGRNDKM